MGNHLMKVYGDHPKAIQKLQGEIPKMTVSQLEQVRESGAPVLQPKATDMWLLRGDYNSEIEGEYNAESKLKLLEEKYSDHPRAQYYIDNIFNEEARAMKAEMEGMQTSSLINILEQGEWEEDTRLQRAKKKGAIELIKNKIKRMKYSEKK